jgi:hypothetical protein
MTPFMNLHIFGELADPQCELHRGLCFFFILSYTGIYKLILLSVIAEKYESLIFILYSLTVLV